MIPEVMIMMSDDDVELLHWALLNLEPRVSENEVTKARWADHCHRLRNELFRELTRRRGTT